MVMGGMGGSKLAELFVEIRADLGKLESGLKRGERQLERFSGKLRSIGRTMTVAAAPIAALGGMSFKAAMDFEDSFAGVRKTVDTTEEGFQQMARSLRDLAKEIPVNVNELNRIAEAAGQLGISAEAIPEFTEVMAKLGTATNLTSEEAATSLARLANVMGTPEDAFENLGSAVVDLGNNFATTESEILDFGQRISGAGKLAGLTEGDILGIGAAMSSIGVNAEAGGTSVQKVLNDITQSVATGGDHLETYARTAGVTSEEFARQWRENAGQAFAAFVQGLGRQGDAAFDTLEELEIGNERVIRAFLGVAQAGDLLGEAMEKGNAAFGENTALNEEAQRRYQTTSAQMQIFKNRLNDIAITIGGPLLAAMNDLLQKLTPIVEAVADFIEAHPQLVQLGIKVAGAMAAVGTALFLIGTILPAIVSGFGALLGPIGLIVAALAGIGVAVATNFGGIRDAVGDFVGEVRASVDRGIEAFHDFRAEGDGLIESLAKAFLRGMEHIGNYLQELLGLEGGFDRVREAARDAIKHVGEFAKENPLLAAGAAAGGLMLARPLARGAAGIAGGALGGVGMGGLAAGATGLLSRLLPPKALLAALPVGAIAAAIATDFMGIRSGITDVVKDLDEKLGGALGRMKEIVQDTFGEMKTAIQEGDFRGAFDAFVEGAKDVGSELADAAPRMLEVMKTLGNDAIDAMKEAAPRVVEFVTEIGDKISEAAPRIFSDLADFASNLAEKLNELIIAEVPGMIETLGEFVARGITGAAALIETMLPKAIQFVEGIFELIIEAFNKLLPRLSEIADVVIPAIFRAMEEVIRALGESIRRLARGSEGGEINGEGVSLAVNLVDAFVTTLTITIRSAIPLLAVVIKELVHTLFVLIIESFKNSPGVRLNIAIFNALKGPITTAMEEISGAVEAIWGGMWDELKRQGRNAIDWVIRAINNLLSGINTVSSVLNAILPGSPIPDDLRIPTLAELERRERARQLTPAEESLRRSMQARRQFGGPVVAGRPYLVGEAGPELFVPPRSGRILSHEDSQELAGGRGHVINVSQHFHGPTSPYEQARAQRREMQRWAVEGGLA